MGGECRCARVCECGAGVAGLDDHEDDDDDDDDLTMIYEGDEMFLLLQT